MWVIVRKRMTRKVLLWLGGIFLLSTVVSFLLAPSIIEYVIRQKLDKIEKKKHIKIELNEFKLSGLTSVSVGSIYVIPLDNDTLLSIRKMNARLGFWRMLMLQPDVETVSLEFFRCKFIKNESYCNYRFLFQTDSKEHLQQSNESNFSDRINALLNLVFRLLPSNLAIKQFQISSNRNELKTVISAENIEVKDHTLTTFLNIEDNDQKQKWKIAGVLDKNERTIQGEISDAEGLKAIVPYIKQIYNTNISFNQLSFHLKSEDVGGITSLSGRASFKALDINHFRLSPDDIQLGNGAADFVVRVGADWAELDSSSQISLNKISFHPYVFAEKKGKWHFKIQVDKPSFSADDLFTSLPKGLFHSFDDMRVTGLMSYHFLFDVDFNHPDNLILESSLKKRGFAITSYGELAKMNSSFLYTAYEHDQPVRTFQIGIENPSFRSLESISPLLRQAVLQSEDGQFFFHRGFRLDALREALIHDIKLKRFARGGSTISMQLVKNVFLNRHKNIARKLEEALVVWLIEENRITSKERMFEVYLNIAEWGPMIYGIGEASHFYFDKEPADLTLNESIFLASIIPSPKRFASSFDATGRLKENRFWHFNSIAERLYRTGYITEEERNFYSPEVLLTGAAKQSIAISADSISILVQ